MIPAQASSLTLPPGPWLSVLDCLCAHFSTIGRAQWLDRFERGRVLDATGTPIRADHVYKEGLRIHYFREVSDEPRLPFAVRIAYSDNEIVVADKPHFLAVMPAGRFVEETLLRRLIRDLGNPDLVPLHRIDRGTAGLVMFSANRASRAQYQALFHEQRITKSYEAIAPALPEISFPLVRRSRIVRGDPFFRMQEIAGAPNSETRVEVIEGTQSSWRYALTPVSGRKHQLRVHMAALGAAILNDRFYPDLSDERDDDLARPLKLLARALAFEDPLSGELRHFASQLTL